MAKKVEMLGVIFDRVNKHNPIVDSEDSLYCLPFAGTEEYFSTYENQIDFIKNCENLVRKDPFYKTYISYLINIVGLKRCEILPGIEIETGSNVVVELHHGPMLTLFDVCNIVLNYARNQKFNEITTFKIADIVLEEHRLNRVKCMMLSKTAHQQVTDQNIFINYRQGFGDVAKFLEIYKTGLDRRLIKKINDYIVQSQEMDSTDNDVLKLSNNLKRWSDLDLDEGIVDLEKYLEMSKTT